MEYRRLGRTEKQVSLLGVGGGYVMLLDIAEGTRIYQRAYELGVNYFDGRYGYTSTMQRPVIQQDREHFVVGTKTASNTRDAALRRIDEDREELGTDYIDVFYLRTYNHEMLEAHFAPGGSVEGLLAAREQGKVRALGLAGHSDLTALAAGVETGLIDVVEFPLNVVRREALDVLIPVCQRHDVGMVIMKPVNVGLVPAEVALPWLANQPVHVMAPGISTMAHLETDAALLDRTPMALSPAEEAEVERWRRKADAETCRICDNVCQAVCEQGLKIDYMIYHNVFANELRRLGVEGFLNYPFAPWVKERAEMIFETGLRELQACTHCGKCEEVCPHHLPVMDLLERVKEDHVAILEALHELNWVEAHQGADSPLPERILQRWLAGGKPKRRT
ncbi:MAG: aldo/keto reductase [Anaerolineae bacterium]